jgi:hypothetical protein
MDAQAVWAVWRRILREPALADWVLGDGPDDDPRVAGLSADELSILRAYSHNKLSTGFFVENYRFRLASSALNALEVAAPLTRRVIDANGHDLNVLLGDLLESTGWLDFGPNVYTFGTRILEYLSSRPEIAAIAGLPDLIRLELTAAAIIMAAANPPEGDPRSSPMARWQVNPWLRLVSCDLDIAGWLKSRANLGQVSPVAGPRQFAVYLPSLVARPRIVALPQAAANLLTRLAGQDQAFIERPEENERILAELSRMGLIWPDRAGSRC